MQQNETFTANSQYISNPVLTVRGKPANPWLALLALVFGLFMALLDVTIVNIAIPSTQSDLHTDLTTVTWVLNAYSLVFAVLLVTMGRFADQYGRKRIFLLGMVIFSVGSLLCALAPTIASLTGVAGIDWLIGARAFQAIGAASLNPVSLAIIMAVFPRERRGAAIGIWGALSGIAAATGPVLGGYLVQNFDWRWIFFVNLPFCIIGLFMVAMFVPETREPGVSRRIDIPGIITLSAAVFCLVLAIIQGNDWGWSSTPILSLFGGTVLATILFFVVELKVKEPIIDFSLFKIGSFTSASFAMFVFGIAIQGAFLILVLYFIYAQGYTQLNAAYAILPIPVASFIVSAFSGAFSQKINPRISALLGMTLLAVGFFLLFTLNVNSTLLDTIWRGLIIGAGMGMCFQSFPNIALSEVPRAKLGVGSGVFNTFRQIGFVLGVAILISLFVGQIQTNITRASNNAIQIVQNDTAIPAQFRPLIINGLKQAVNNAGNSQQLSSQNVDLTQFANNAPPQFRAQARASLKALGDKITAEFQKGVVQSFTATWLAAAFAAVVGVLLTFFTLVSRRKRGSLVPKSESHEEVDVPAVL